MFNVCHTDAYERLLLDVIHGRLALFMCHAELVAAWPWVMPIMDCWAADETEPKLYAVSTWEPTAASALLSKNNTCWHEEL